MSSALPKVPVSTVQLSSMPPPESFEQRPDADPSVSPGNPAEAPEIHEQSTRTAVPPESPELAVSLVTSESAELLGGSLIMLLAPESSGSHTPKALGSYAP